MILTVWRIDLSSLQYSIVGTTTVCLGDAYADSLDQLFNALLQGYKKDVHPNSDQPKGQIDVRADLSPIYLDIVSILGEVHAFKIYSQYFLYWLSLITIFIIYFYIFILYHQDEQTSLLTLHGWFGQVN